ncbi:MAG: hypothetical protein WA610_03680 [Thermodesulfovibrionales bacterium]
MTIYLMIMLSPLAMHSKVFAHAMTGECSGDCNICGCSLESRVNRTCCCAVKKQKQSGFAKLTTGGCCTPNAAAHATAKSGCCAAPQQKEPVVVKNDCCAKKRQTHCDANALESQQEAVRSQNETVYKCGESCGKGKMLIIAGAGISELLPYIYSIRILRPHENIQYFHLSQRLASRHTEPSDQPPNLPLSA